MRIIGLVGGVASGKSLVARQLEELGAAVLDADRAGHEVLRWPDVIQILRQRWGERVLDAQGQPNRAAIAHIVFAPTPEGRRELDFLMSQTHPRIGKLLEQQLAALKVQGREVAVLDAPVMLEAGWDALCDETWFVDTPRDLRWERAQGRGWSEDQFQARESSQLPIEEKRRRADRVIDNAGSADATRRQVQRYWHEIVPDP